MIDWRRKDGRGQGKTLSSSEGGGTGDGTGVVVDNAATAGRDAAPPQRDPWPRCP